MRARLLLLTAFASAPASASAQLPFLTKRGPVPQTAAQDPIDLLRSDFAAQSGGTTVYFAPGSSQLTPQARTVLQGQAVWLRQHPSVAVRVEGHGDPTDTRDHALALGAERPAEARNYLMLLGTPAAQVSTMTWGKERPGPPSAMTTIVQSGGAPVVPAVR